MRDNVGTAGALRSPLVENFWLGFIFVCGGLCTRFYAPSKGETTDEKSNQSAYCDSNCYNILRNITRKKRNARELQPRNHDDRYKDGNKRHDSRSFPGEAGRYLGTCALPIKLSSRHGRDDRRDHAARAPKVGKEVGNHCEQDRYRDRNPGKVERNTAHLGSSASHNRGILTPQSRNVKAWRNLVEDPWIKPLRIFSHTKTHAPAKNETD